MVKVSFPPDSHTSNLIFARIVLTAGDWTS